MKLGHYVNIDIDIMQVNNVMINYVMQGRMCVLQVKCWDVPVQWMICWRAALSSWLAGEIDVGFMRQASGNTTQFGWWGAFQQR